MLTTAIVLVAILIIAGGWAAISSGEINGGSNKIQVVAAENFWGSLVSQIGGSHVQVFSIVSDPNADPHEYESNTADARAVATADYVIINGAGYDSWAQNLINAGTKADARVLNVADLLGKKNGDNPHMWYDPTYVNEVALQMEKDLISIDPADTTYFQQQYADLTTALGTYQQEIVEIKDRFAGTEVASTESIFEYLANATGLDLVSPTSFMEAVSEGNDPSSQDIVTFEQQLATGNVRLLVYNTQTVTPLTSNIETLAAQDGVPVVGITETIQPPNLSFQDWMYGEVVAIYEALSSSVNGGST